MTSSSTGFRWHPSYVLYYGIMFVLVFMCQFHSIWSTSDYESLSSSATITTPISSSNPTIKNDSLHEDCTSSLSLLSSSSSPSSLSLPLECWIYKVHIPLPDVEVQDGLLHVYLSDMYCTHFQFVTAENERVMNFYKIMTYTLHHNTNTHSNDGTVWDVELRNIGATCYGRYHSAGTHGKFHGSTNPDMSALNATLVPYDTMLNADTAVDKYDHNSDDEDKDGASIKALESINITSLHSDIEILPESLHVSGMAGTLVNSFKTHTAQYITSNLNAALEAHVDDFNGKGMNIISTINEYVLQVIQNSKADSNTSELEYFRRSEQESIRYYTSTPYSALTHGISHLNTLLQQNDMILHALCGILRSQIPYDKDGNWMFTIPFPTPMEIYTWTNNGIGTVRVELLSIQVSIPIRNVHVLLQSLQFMVLKGTEHTIRFEMVLGEEVEVQIQSDIRIVTHVKSHSHNDSSDHENSDGNPVLVEYTTVHSTIRNTTFSMDVYTGLNQYAFELLYIHQLYHTPIDCILNQVLDVAHVQNMTLAIDVQELFLIPHGMNATTSYMASNDGDSMESVLNAALNTILGYSTQHYSTFLHMAIQSFVQGPIRQCLNELLRTSITSYYNNNTTKCEEQQYNPKSAVNYVRWTQNTLLRALRGIATPNILNAVIPYILPYTNRNSSAVFSYVNEDYGVQIQYLNTSVSYGTALIQDATLFEAEEDSSLGIQDAHGWYHANSELSLAQEHEGIVLQGDLRIVYNTTDADDNSSSTDTEVESVEESYHVTTTLQSLYSSIHTYILYDINKWYQLHIGQILHVHTNSSSTSNDFEVSTSQNHTPHNKTYCILQPMKDFDLYNASYTMQLFRMVLHSTSSTSTNNNQQDVVLDKNDVTNVLNHVISQSMGFVARYITRLMRTEMVYAKLYCHDDSITSRVSTASLNVVDSDDGNSNDDSENDVGLWCGIFIPIAVLLLAFIVWRYLVTTSTTNVTSNSTDRNNVNEHECLSSHDDVANTTAYALLQDSDRNDMEIMIPSLLNTTLLPSTLRYLIVASIIGTISLFIISNNNIGATVDFVVYTSTSSIVPNSDVTVYDFSLVSILQDMYHAGTYMLLLLIFVMSVLVPYVKLLCMLYVWCAPPRILHPNTRDKILHTLECIGKYALVDAFVLVIMVASFRYQLTLYADQVMILQNITDFVELNIYVNPQSGFYCFLCATIMSIMLGHVVLFCHRYVSATHVVPEYSDSKLLLDEHVFNVSKQYPRQYHNNDTDNNRESDPHVKYVRLSPMALTMIQCTLLLCTVLISIGMTTRSFEFEFFGLAGLPLDDPDRSYSLLSIGYEIPTSVQDEHSFGSLFIQASYYFYAVFMPFTFILLTTLMLMMPLQTKTQMWVLALIEVSSAWTALEVFMISMIASLAEISDIASYIVGDICDDINTFLEQSVFFDAILDGHDTCFDVEAHLHTSSSILFVGTVLMFVLMFFLVRILRQAVEERVQREGRKIVACRSSSDVIPDSTNAADTSHRQSSEIEALQHAGGEGSIDDNIGMVQVMYGYKCLRWMFVPIVGDDVIGYNSLHLQNQLHVPLLSSDYNNHGNKKDEIPLHIDDVNHSQTYEGATLLETEPTMQSTVSDVTGTACTNNDDDNNNDDTTTAG